MLGNPRENLCIRSTSSSLAFDVLLLKTGLLMFFLLLCPIIKYYMIWSSPHSQQNFVRFILIRKIYSQSTVCVSACFSPSLQKKNYDLWIIIKTEEYLLPSTTMIRIKIASKTCDLMLLFTFFLPFSIFHRFWAIINAADFA